MAGQSGSAARGPVAAAWPSATTWNACCVPPRPSGAGPKIKAYQKLNGPSVLREGAFLVARGRLALEEATGIKGFLDQLVPLGGHGTHLSALAVAIEQRRDDVPPPSSLLA